MVNIEASQTSRGQELGMKVEKGKENENGRKTVKGKERQRCSSGKRDHPSKDIVMDPSSNDGRRFFFCQEEHVSKQRVVDIFNMEYEDVFNVQKEKVLSISIIEVVDGVEKEALIDEGKESTGIVRKLNIMLKNVGVGYYENTQYYHRASKGWRVLENDQKIMELEKWANSNRVVDLYVEHNKAYMLNPSQAESTCGNGVTSKSSSDKDEVDSEECSQGESSRSEYFYDSEYDMENSQLYENAVDDDSNFVGKGKRVESNKQKGDQNVKAIGMDNDSG
ncbi:unnamed protein product [Ilex paraguariensis]|uniref:Uncharacterized protein n=1 Tax=Ilex paraguariensis TaxID=185542 RepID=A0ABC8REP7_9AQUA